MLRMEANDTSERLLSIREAAGMLHIGAGTCRRLIANGELPAHRVGGQLRIDPAELRQWLDANATHPDQAA